MARTGLFPNGNPQRAAKQAYARGFESEGVGRDPRTMEPAELRAMGHGQPLLRTIRTNCIECCGGYEAEVRRCGCVWCPFWPYRMGTNPFHRQSLSPEQRAALSERMRAARKPSRDDEAG